MAGAGIYGVSMTGERMTGDSMTGDSMTGEGMTGPSRTAIRGADAAARMESFDGVEIFYQWWNGRDSRPPVALCHGFAADANSNWVATGIVAALQQRGRSVLAMDARGHGQSDKPHQPHQYGEGRMAKDLGRLLDLLDIPVVDLLGYSMGAVVSLLFAAADPRVRRLVVGGVGAGVVELGGVDTRVLPNELLVRALLAADPTTIDHPGVAAFRAFADALKADRKALAAQAQAVNTRPIALANIQSPTLIVAGEDDPLAQRPQLLQNAIAWAQLHTLPGDHLSVLRHPDFASRVAEFLSRD